MAAKPIDDGGPAFPELCTNGSNGDYWTSTIGGMSLRDYFAAKALHAAWCTWDAGYFDLNKNSETAVSDIATLSYQMADAMLKARAK